MRLIESLRSRQGERSQQEFATELGVAQGTVSKIYSGYRGIGPDVARKIVRRYPELAFEVAAFLLGSDMPHVQTHTPVEIGGHRD